MFIVQSRHTSNACYILSAAPIPFTERKIETEHRESSCQRDSVEQIEKNAEQRTVSVSIQFAHPLEQIQSIPVSKYLPSNVRGSVCVCVCE